MLAFHLAPQGSDHFCQLGYVAFLSFSGLSICLSFNPHSLVYPFVVLEFALMLGSCV